MGLYLNRDKSGGYRRAWYAKISEGGRMTGRRLKTPLRGKKIGRASCRERV